MTKDTDMDELQIELETPLTNAIEINKNPQKIKELIANGANPDNPTFFDETPLGFAIQYNNINIATLLLENGADANQKTCILQESDGHWRSTTPLEIAIKNNNSLAVSLLLEYGAEIKTEYIQRAITENKTKEVIEPLIEHIENIDKKDKDGMTLLMYAAESNEHKDVIELLVDKGADVNKTNNDGMPPLMLAIQNDNTPVICGILINKYRADINIRDNKGKSALDYAEEEDNVDVIRFLKQKLNNK